MDANPYLTTRPSTSVTKTNLNTAVFPWDQLLHHAEDTAGQILGRCSSRIVAHCMYRRRVPAALEPPGHELYAWIEHTLEIERSRADILGHGPGDTLTVTLSTRLTDGQFRNTTQQFQDALRAAMVRPTRTWTEVSGIRVTRAYNVHTRWFVELVRRGPNGDEFVRVEPWSLNNETGWTSRYAFVRMLTDELHLRQVASGAHFDQYAI